MEDHTVLEPLLSSTEEVCCAKSTNSVKWVLKILMWGAFIAWLALIFLYPFGNIHDFLKDWVQTTGSTFLGVIGTEFLLFNGPLLLIVFLSAGYLIISAKENPRQNTQRHPSYRLRTLPVLVEGPLGIVSAAELIGILFFVFYVIWAVSVHTARNIGVINEATKSQKEKIYLMIRLSGLSFGNMGAFCLAFLFLPIARGSVLLRLLDIPFVHAVRYHIWMGHLTMFLLTVHGLLFVFFWSSEGQLLTEILEWDGTEADNVAGVISLSAGLVMWVTSLPVVRKRCFELFYYTHHLYVVFIIFMAFHGGSFFFSIAAGGIFLFMLDRFLRFCQSRQAVDIVSATPLSFGAVKLALSKPPSLHYKALSFVFVRIPRLSWLQWHPFSVSSSPLDEESHLSVHIKGLGKWTKELHSYFSSTSEAAPRDFRITASVEGPYGHEFPYHLTYRKLMLIAGGIGISPFLGVVSDIQHIIRAVQPCLPRDVLIVWSVKSSNELTLLLTTDHRSKYFSKDLKLEILIYVTRESEPSLEECTVDEAMSSPVCPFSNGCRMSVLVGTGNKIWSGVYVVLPLLGFLILVGLLNIFYIYPSEISSVWCLGILLLACMTVSILIFGGIVVGLWSHWERKTCPHHSESENLSHESNGENAELTPNNEPVALLAGSTSVRYGSRPNFGEIFGSLSESWGNTDVGVFVCGPSSLESSVARECRSRNRRRQRHHPVFHFNSHSFSL